MKKIFSVFISLALIFSIGCSKKIDQGSENIKEIDKGQVSENENNIEETKDEYNIQDIKDTESTNKEEYEEITRIAEEINLEDYDMQLEFDNKETRIIIFKKDGLNTYKSIFIKEKRQLKLLDLISGEGPLINEII